MKLSNYSYGNLHDYNTAEVIRPATKVELQSSLDAAIHDSGAGVILVGGRACYVQGESVMSFR